MRHSSSSIISISVAKTVFLSIVSKEHLSIHFRLMDFVFCITLALALVTIASPAALPTRTLKSPTGDLNRQQGLASYCPDGARKWKCSDSKLQLGNIKDTSKRVSRAYRKLKVKGRGIPVPRLSEKLKSTGAVFCPSSLYRQLDLYRQVFQQLYRFYTHATGLCLSEKPRPGLCKSIKDVGQAVEHLQENILKSHPETNAIGDSSELIEDAEENEQHHPLQEDLGNSDVEITRERSELAKDVYVSEDLSVDTADRLGASLVRHLKRSMRTWKKNGRNGCGRRKKRGKGRENRKTHAGQRKRKAKRDRRLQKKKKPSRRSKKGN